MKNAAEKHLNPPPKVGRLKEGWRKWKVSRLMDMGKAAAPELAKLGFPPLPYLLESVRNMDAKSAKAAYLIGKVAESGTDCEEARHPLYDMLMTGDEMQKANSAVALARIGTQEARSMLLAALGDRNNIIRRYATIGLGITGNPSVEGALKKVAEGDPDSEVRRLAENALKQIAEFRQP